MVTAYISFGSPFLSHPLFSLGLPVSTETWVPIMASGNLGGRGNVSSQAAWHPHSGPESAGEVGGGLSMAHVGCAGAGASALVVGIPV